MITSAIAQSDLYFYKKIIGKYRKTERNRFKLPMMIFRRNTANIFNQNFFLDIPIKFYFNNQNTICFIITKTAQDIKRLFSWFRTDKYISQFIQLSDLLKNIQNIFSIKESILFQTTRKKDLYPSYFLKKRLIIFKEYYLNKSPFQGDQKFESISITGKHDIFPFILKEPDFYSPDVIEKKSMIFGRYHFNNFFLQRSLELKIPDLISQARTHDAFPFKRKEPDFYSPDVIEKKSMIFGRYHFNNFFLQSSLGLKIPDLISQARTYDTFPSKLKEPDFYSPDIPMKRSIIFNNYYYFIKMLYQNSLKLKNKDVLSYSSQNISFDLNEVHQPLYSSGDTGINLYLNHQIPGNINFMQTINIQTKNMHEYASVLKRTSPHLNILLNYNVLSGNNQQFNNVYNNRIAPDKPSMTHYYYNPGSTNVIINPERTAFQTDGKDLHYHTQQKIEQEIEQIKKTIIKTKEEMENQSQSTSIPDDADIKKQFDIDQISDQVYQVIEQKIRIEKEQRGF
ncbi:MAG: hypothetical protein C5S41_13340 [Candidatus Methanomarinus sp.]|nr:MAG: hypothetical protein C5S41_13340 [ANME-2 cluster archaeon]